MTALTRFWSWRCTQWLYISKWRKAASCGFLSLLRVICMSLKVILWHVLTPRQFFINQLMWGIRNIMTCRNVLLVFLLLLKYWMNVRRCPRYEIQNTTIEKRKQLWSDFLKQWLFKFSREGTRTSSNRCWNQMSPLQTPFFLFSQFIEHVKKKYKYKHNVKLISNKKRKTIEIISNI